MRHKIPRILDTLLDESRQDGAVQRHLARQRRSKPPVAPVAVPDQDAELNRLQAIEDAARDVVLSWMCGEPVTDDIETLRLALGIECCPV